VQTEFYISKRKENFSPGNAINTPMKTRAIQWLVPAFNIALWIIYEVPRF